MKRGQKSAGTGLWRRRADMVREGDIRDIHYCVEAVKVFKVGAKHRTKLTTILTTAFQRIPLRLQRHRRSVRLDG